MNLEQILKDAYGVVSVPWVIGTSYYPVGFNVLNEDWDILVVLDACRVDALESIVSEYAWLSTPEARWSRGSTSKEWIERTFTKNRELEDVALITANPFTHQLYNGVGSDLYYNSIINSPVNEHGRLNKLVNDIAANADDFGHIEPLWGSSKLGAGFFDSQLPSTVTDYGIVAARKEEWDRVVLHYMQPHVPYFSTSTNYEELEEYEQDPFAALKNGADKELIWEAYLDNTRFALDNVETLIENVDGKVAITADHGELFGECGLRDHLVGFPHPALRKVPWLELKATDEKTYQPDTELLGEKRNTNVDKEHLNALGYV